MQMPEIKIKGKSATRMLQNLPEYPCIDFAVALKVD